MRIFNVILFCILGLSVFPAQAVSAPPAIHRACLDRNTGEVTVYFAPSTDNCGSFVKYVLYGRENTSDPFTVLAESTTLLSTQITAPLSSKKKWQLYIAVLYACNGSDSLFSDTVYIDDQPPAYLEPDSVSIDPSTQKVIAGWSAAPEPDVMGYTIFKVDPGTGNNLVVDEQNVLFYTFDITVFDSKKSGNRIALAAYDSCRNGGIISNYHSPVLLTPATGQNIDFQCTKKLYIQWSAYVGWPVSSYDVYVKDNISNTWTIVSSLPGTQLNYTFNIPILGPTYSFFIRAHKQASMITSSSNIIDIPAPDFTRPNRLTLGHVSVISSGSIQITANWQNTPSITEVVLQKRNYGGIGWLNLATFNPATSGFRYVISGVQPDNYKYDFRIVIKNSCGEVFDSSGVHTSILLKRQFLRLSWNSYYGWPSKSESTTAEERDKSVSTWNNLGIYIDSQLLLTDTSKALCYRIAVYKIDGTGNITDTAYSNEVCIRVLDTTLVPSAFSPGGHNPVFKIVNPNLTGGQATMNIYDRWGGKLFSGDALVGWDGTDPHGKFVGPGFYPYLIEVTTSEYRKVYKGTVSIIR